MKITRRSVLLLTLCYVTAVTCSDHDREKEEAEKVMTPHVREFLQLVRERYKGEEKRVPHRRSTLFGGNPDAIGMIQQRGRDPRGGGRVRLLPLEEARPTLHIRVSSFRQITRIVERLRDLFPMRLESGRPQESASDQLYLELAGTDEPAPTPALSAANATTTRRPSWIDGKACKREIKSLRGYNKELLDLLSSTVRCREESNRYVCVESFGSGKSPNLQTIYRCCRGYRLIRGECVRIATKKGGRHPASLVSGTKPGKRRKIHHRGRDHRRHGKKHQQGSKRKRPQESRVSGPEPTPSLPREFSKHRRRPHQVSNVTSFLANFNLSTVEANIAEDMIDNSIIEGAYLLKKDFRNNAVYRARSGIPLRFNHFSEADVWTVNCRKVINFDIERLEGAAPGAAGLHQVSHVIEGVIASGTARSDMVGYLNSRPGKFSAVLQALTRTGTIEHLTMATTTEFDGNATSGGGLTLLAPTNDAFDRLPVPLRNETDTCLRELMRPYLVDGIFCSASTPPGGSERTLQSHVTDDVGVTMVARSDGQDRLRVGGVRVVNRDVVTANGVVHGLDDLLYPVRSLREVLAGEQELENFNEFYTASSKLDHLATVRNGTLIAPTRIAFTGNKQIESYHVMDDPELLRRHIEYYVVEGKWDREALMRTNGATLRTVHEGRPVHVSVYPVRVGVEGQPKDVRVQAVALQCTRVPRHQPVTTRSCAGPVLTMDEMLQFPNQRTIMEILETHPDNVFSTLVRVIREMNLQHLLEMRDEVHTFFAPTNEIFARLSPLVMERFGNPETARQYITFHLVPGYRCYDELMQRPYRLATINGQTVHTCPKVTHLRLGRRSKKLRVTVTHPGLLADNGIVHGVDNILIPRVATSAVPRDDGADDLV